jgi:hypothetical protein
MIIPTQLRELAGRHFLSKVNALDRTPRAIGIPGAKNVAILYVDRDEELFKHIKGLVNILHTEYAVDQVCALGFIDKSAKEVPVYHAQKLEYRYLTRTDLNWYYKPVKNLMNFTDEPFDVLLDLRSAPCLALNFVLKASMAKMKVGSSLSHSEEALDVTLQLPHSSSESRIFKELIQFLNQPLFK